MIGRAPNLSPKKSKAIAALLQHRTLKDAAAAIDIAEATLFRWLQDHNFQQVLRGAKRQVVQQAVSRLQQVSCEAVETLLEIASDREKPASARLGAARAILDYAIKGVEYEDLLTRIEALENHLNNEKIK